MSEPSTELVTVDLDAVRAALIDGIELPEADDPDLIARQIVLRILQADTPEKVLEPAATTSAQDILGVPIEVASVRWAKSSLEGGPPLFAIFEGQRLDEGEPVVVTCSGRNVMAQAVALTAQDAWPLTIKFVQAERQTSRGYRPLWLAPATAGRRSHADKPGGGG